MNKSEFIINIVLFNKKGEILNQSQVGKPFETLLSAKSFLFDKVETIKRLMSDSINLKHREEHFKVDKQEDMNMLTVVMDNKKKRYRKAVFTIVPIY